MAERIIRFNTTLVWVQLFSRVDKLIQKFYFNTTLVWVQLSISFSIKRCDFYFNTTLVWVQPAARRVKECIYSISIQHLFGFNY